MMAAVTTRPGAMRILWKWRHAIVVVSVAGLFLAPLVASRSAVPPDLVNHLWAVRVQAQSFRQHLAPSYFINANATGIYYPLFVFYGGTLYAAVGAFAAVLGHAEVAFLGSIAAAVMAAYAGWVWLSRQLGVRSWRAHAAAVTYVSSAYYVTNLYGRGDWPEFMATSTIPLVIASAWRVASSPRLEPTSATLLVVAVVFFCGSHNVTLVMGSLVMAATVLMLWLAGGRAAVAPQGHRRILGLAGLIALGVAVDAWFLVPDLAHAAQTQIASGAALMPWTDTGFFNTPGIIFNPLRAVPSESTTPGLYVQAPDWFLLWALAASAATLSRTSSFMRRATALLLVLLAALLALIMIGSVWGAMPRPVRATQFPYRINTYVALCVAGLVLTAVAATNRAPAGRRAVLNRALVGVMAVSVALCGWQMWKPRVAPRADPGFYGRLSRAFTPLRVSPVTWSAASADYADSSQRVIVTPPSAYLSINPAVISSSHVTLTLTPPVAQGPFLTNVAGGPYAVRVSGGLVRIGRSPSGFAVMRRRSAGAGPVTFSLSTAGGALETGQIISILALIAIVAGVFWLLMYRLGTWYGRRRTARRRVDPVAQGPSSSLEVEDTSPVGRIPGE